MNSRQRHDDGHDGQPLQFKCEVKYGYVRLLSSYRKEGDCLVCYVHRIEYDRDGREIMRSEPEAIGRLCPDQDQQPKDYSRTLIMLTVVGFAVMSLALELFQ